MIDKIVKFVKETRAETKKVVWPERRYVAMATTMVIVIVIITGIYVLFVDYAFASIFGALIR